MCVLTYWRNHGHHDRRLAEWTQRVIASSGPLITVSGPRCTGRHVLLLYGLGVAGEQDAGKQKAHARTRSAALISLGVSCSTA
jgi:hypothetical protein